MTDDINITLLRASDIMRELSIGRTTLTLWVKRGLLPQPIRLGRITAWRRSDINALIERLDRERGKRDAL